MSKNKNSEATKNPIRFVSIWPSKFQAWLETGDMEYISAYNSSIPFAKLSARDNAKFSNSLLVEVYDDNTASVIADFSQRR